jgi:hypothetical protein
MTEKKPINTNKHFTGQTDDEHVILFFRHHWVVLFNYLLLILLFILIVIIGISLLVNFQITPETIKSRDEIKYIITGIIIFSIFLHNYIFNKLLNYFLDVIIITNYRIVEVTKTIYLRNVVKTLDLERVQDIQGHKVGVLENLFGYGDLVMTSASINFEKRIHSVPTPHFYSDIINKMKHEHSKVQTQENEPKDEIQNNNFLK